MDVLLRRRYYWAGFTCDPCMSPYGEAVLRGDDDQLTSSTVVTPSPATSQPSRFSHTPRLGTASLDEWMDGRAWEVTAVVLFVYWLVCVLVGLQVQIGLCCAFGRDMVCLFRCGSRPVLLSPCDHTHGFHGEVEAQPLQSNHTARHTLVQSTCPWHC